MKDLIFNNQNSLFLCCFFIVFLSCAQKQTISKKNSDNYALVDSLATIFLEKTRLPGISIAVSKEGKVLYQKGFGYADLENKIKMQPETQLRTASVAKIITATALGKLATNNMLDFDLPVKKYVPYLKSPFNELTVRQLAGHTSGVQHRPSKNTIRNKYYTSIKETIGLFDKTPLLFQPDTDYKYSTNGYNILSAVIEGASGKSYNCYMEEEIFKPLQMTQTFPENINELGKNDAKLYYFDRKSGNLLLDNELTDGSYKLAGAGFRSTSLDLTRMMDAYYNGFIAAEIVKDMFTTNRLKNGEKTQVGIGWRTSFDTFGNAPLDHAGSWQGARTVVVHYPNQKLNFVIMINAQCQIFIEETAHNLAQIFINDNKETKTGTKINSQISIKNNRYNGKVEHYEGTLELDASNNGTLTVNTNLEYLKSNPIRYLGFGNNYVLVTSYGLYYLTIDSSLNGKLYIYQNRNKENPLNKEATISFVATQ